jgi:hypothetical protein
LFPPPPFTNLSPILGSVVAKNIPSNLESLVLDIRGNSFLPNSFVQLGPARLVTLYLGAQHLIAFVPPRLIPSVDAGITIINPGPGGGNTNPVNVGFHAAPLPIPEVETGPIRSGYAVITPDAGTAIPAGALTFGMVHDAVVQSQATVLPTPPTAETLIMVDVLQSAGRNVGLAVANTSATAATVTLTLRDAAGGGRLGHPHR